MHFKVTARTMLQLGSELISSDAIAFYELIKNAFDALSPKVEVRIVIRLPQELVKESIEMLFNDSAYSKKNELINRLINNLDTEAPESSALRELLHQNPCVENLIKILKEANYILIKDRGEGMSLKDLEDIYLTIGTRNRHKQRTQVDASGVINQVERPILGEKGLGRLSVMRLGEGLKIETTQKGENNYNLLEIDWTLFSHDSDALLDSIEVEPKKGRLKDNIQEQGTTIFIYDLRSFWSKYKLEEISREQLSRFIDPFKKANRDFIVLWFNKVPIILPGIDKILFQNAHATVKAELIFDDSGNPSLLGELHYKTYDRHKTFNLSGTHLASVISSDIASITLRSLGPFNVEFYWYNRQLITKKEGIVDAPYVKNLVSTWGGGLMVYRDGFRVNPYGGPNDDWLTLDPTALSSPGYKLNRRQIVGKVDISSMRNPALRDQTNREGLRDNVEKKALVTLLQYIIWKELRFFLDNVKVDEQSKAATLNVKDIETRIVSGQNKIRETLNYLMVNHPDLDHEREAISTIEGVLKDSDTLFKAVKASSAELERRLNTTINLAGLGLMIDVIAHELNRATQHAIMTINTLTAQELSQKAASAMSTLRAQLKTLQTRLKVLDPLGPSGRQHRTLVDLKKLLNDTFQYHEAQFERNGIQLFIEDESQEEWNIQVVPGMIVQVIENLISNAVFWLKQEQIINKLQHAEIRVRIDRNRKQITFSDNGPGVPRAKKEEIFLPFFSTKPPGEGKGLGLYISREIAQYHGASLYLEVNSPSDTLLHTFVLDFHTSK